MSLSIGIVGLPNAGKSTLFRALTKNKVDIAPYPFTTIEPNRGIVFVPDRRLEKLAEIIKPRKITPAAIEFVDIAGLIKGAHRGQGLGNRFLAEIRNCDAILNVIRRFENSAAENILGEINPEKEAEIIRTELLMKDLETLENLVARAKEKLKTNDKSAAKKFLLLEKIKEAVSRGKTISGLDLTDEEKKEIKEYQFLTQKPVFYVLNDGEETESKELSFPHLTMNFKKEELSEDESGGLNLKSGLDRIILACYNILELITFFTIKRGEEIRAWAIKKDCSAIEAAGIVHSDFEKKFAKAEIIPCQKLIQGGVLKRLKEKGEIKTAGKNYIIQEGDIVEFKI